MGTPSPKFDNVVHDLVCNGRNWRQGARTDPDVREVFVHAAETIGNRALLQHVQLTFNSVGRLLTAPRFQFISGKVLPTRCLCTGVTEQTREATSKQTVNSHMFDQRITEVGDCATRISGR